MKRNNNNKEKIKNKNNFPGSGMRRSAAPNFKKMTFFEKMTFLTFLGLETIGKRSGVVESVG